MTEAQINAHELAEKIMEASNEGVTDNVQIITILLAIFSELEMINQTIKERR